MIWGYHCFRKHPKWRDGGIWDSAVGTGCADPKAVKKPWTSSCVSISVWVGIFLPIPLEISTVFKMRFLFEDRNQRSLTSEGSFFRWKNPHWEAPLGNPWQWLLRVTVWSWKPQQKPKLEGDVYGCTPKNQSGSFQSWTFLFFFSGMNFGYYSLGQYFVGVGIKLLMSAMKSRWCVSKVKLIATFVFWILSTHHESRVSSSQCHI